MTIQEPIISSFFGKREVPIYKGPFILEVEGSTISADGEIRMLFGHTNFIQLEGSIASQQTELVDFINNKNKGTTLRTETNLTAQTGHVGGVFNLWEQHSTISATPNFISSFSESLMIDCLQLHVSNFIELRGGSVVDYGSLRTFAHMTITIEEWELTIQRGYDIESKKIAKNSEDEWDYALTHIIEIRKSNNMLFLKEDAESIIETLRLGFSLCAGRRVGFPILIGYKEGEKVAEEYKRIFMDRYEKKPNWVRDQHGLLYELLPKLHKTIKDQYIHTALARSIHWLCEANQTSFVGQPVIPAQVGLETVWWLILTQLPKSPMTEEEFKKKKTKAYMRMKKMAEVIQLNTDIPNLPSLRLQETNIRDFPTLFTQYRNHLTHPKPNAVFEKMNVMDSYNIGRTGILYLELGLLYIIGYKGNYLHHSDQKEWQTKHVPWAFET